MTSMRNMAANFFSAANENMVALANLKFDFSLIKVEAPKEYSKFGVALSNRRKIDAEKGPYHRTARRLGALFEQLVPSTPQLIKAYGRRSSEIIQTSDINPEGSSDDGPFKAFVGADGTAMWAAATSGIPALAVYLLACLLARAWDGQEATSIWSEIVEHRRREIIDGFENHDIVSESSRMSVFQEISRKDLARWDASARAWLQSADRAKLKQQTQPELIAKNVYLPSPSGSSNYSQIINSWRGAMTSLESLLRGEPQEISNSAILMAYSAWHLYPDLIVPGGQATKVVFSDQCVDSRGVGMLVYEHRSMTAGQGTRWSLALSHLRYYGDPVVVESSIDFSRVTIQQLHIIALGNIYKHWDVSKRDTSSVAQWFVHLWDYLMGLSTDPNGSETIKGLDWLQHLAEAAARIDSPDQDVRVQSLALLAYGQRRAKDFLATSIKPLAQFFNLRSPWLLTALSEVEGGEASIVYLREIAANYGLSSSEAFIGFVSKEIVDGESYHTEEYMTAIPHARASRKRDDEGNQLEEAIHGRWLHIHAMAPSKSDTIRDFVMSKARERLRQIESRGEHGVWIPESFAEAKEHWKWKKPPLLFDFEKHAKFASVEYAETDSYCCPSLAYCGTSCLCFNYDADQPAQDAESAEFWCWKRIGNFGLYIEHDAYCARISAKFSPQIYDLDLEASSAICTSKIKRNILAEYLLCFSSICKRCNTNHKFDSPYDSHKRWPSHQESWTSPSSHPVMDFVNDFPSCMHRLMSLKALALATKTYLILDGAMISLKLVDRPLHEAPWLEKAMFAQCLSANIDANSIAHVSSLRGPDELSCIVHFESGILRLEPEVLLGTLAVASGNSLFVVGRLLSDPFDAAARDRARRITGNIGRPGISLLVAPVDPKIRPLGNQYNLVTHAAYDAKREDNFKSTSLHLSFSEWTMPLEIRGMRTGTIDQDAHYIESIVSVLDSGKWVADLDVLRIDFDRLTKLRFDERCRGHPHRELDSDPTSIDTWEELLDSPDGVGIVRAHGNWAARLAAVSILCQQDRSRDIGLLGPEDFCFSCLARTYGVGGSAQHKSSLPPICID